MKKLILPFLLIPLMAYAGGLFSANKAVLTWEPVVKYDNGVAMSESVLAQISYTIYQTDMNDLKKERARPIISVVNGTEYLISLDAEGAYTFGVEAVRTVDGKIVSKGRIVWLQEFPDTPDGIIYYMAPGATGKVGVK